MIPWRPQEAGVGLGGKMHEGVRQANSSQWGGAHGAAVGFPYRVSEVVGVNADVPLAMRTVDYEWWQVLTRVAPVVSLNQHQVPTLYSCHTFTDHFKTR